MRILLPKARPVNCHSSRRSFKSTISIIEPLRFHDSCGVQVTVFYVPCDRPQHAFHLSRSAGFPNAAPAWLQGYQRAQAVVDRHEPRARLFVLEGDPLRMAAR